VVSASELANDPRFATPRDRSVNRAVLRPILQELPAGRSASEWFDIFTEALLPCAPINDVRGGIEFAERIGLEPVVEVGAGEHAVPGVRNPITFSATPASYDLVPPGIDAVPTLSALVHNNLSASKTAEQLAIPEDLVVEARRRIEALLALDLSRVADLMRISMALEVDDVIEARQRNSIIDV